MEYLTLVIVFICIIAFIIYRLLLISGNTPKTYTGGVELISQYFPVVEVHNASDNANIEYMDNLTKSNKTHTIRGYKYKDWRSDKQMSTIARFGNADEFSRLCKMVTRYFPYGERRKIVNDLFSKKDHEIYNLIKIDRNTDDRGRGQADEIFRAISKLLTGRGIPSIDSRKYLDIGCGDGSITKLLAEYFKADEVHCIDPKTFNVTGIQYHKPQSILPWEDGYFDVITAIMSLHHISNVEQVTRELYRVMKPGGILIIKEHDCWNPMDAMLVDIEHCIFINVLEKTRTVDVDNIVAHYKNYYAWDETLKPFQYVNADFYYNKIHHEINPSRTYVAVYKK